MFSQSLTHEDHRSQQRVSDALGALIGRNDALVGECAYLSVLNVRRQIGISRLRLGALLCVLHDSEGWRGKTSAKTFRAFLVEEGIEPKAYFQYMEVARRFVLELQCAKHQLEQLAGASMRALVLASRVVNDSNLNEVVDILAFQPRPEAMEALEALRAQQELKDQPGSALHSDGAPQERLVRSKPVSKILDQVGDLTMDQKAELFRSLRGPDAAKAVAKAARTSAAAAGEAVST